MTNFQKEFVKQMIVTCTDNGKLPLDKKAIKVIMETGLGHENNERLFENITTIIDICNKVGKKNEA